jgi:chromate transport protein ChrA
VSFSSFAVHIFFFGLGMTSFGGPAMTAYIRRMAVEQKWLDNSKGKLGIIV